MQTSNASTQRARSAVTSSAAQRRDPRNEFMFRLEHAIEHAAHLLPAQGPITTFVHHNTLHAFEDLPFVEAVEQAAVVFGCEPYWSETRYRDELKKGRIRTAELEAVLREELAEHADDEIVPGCTRLRFRLALLEYPVRVGPTAELLWYVAETDALRRVSQDVPGPVRSQWIDETRRWAVCNGQVDKGGNQESVDGVFDRASSRPESWSESDWEAFGLRCLWRVCGDGVARVPRFDPPRVWQARLRDILLAVIGVDSDPPVHDVLIRFTAAFLDQGLSHWPLPRRDEGFFRAFVELYRNAQYSPAPWQRKLANAVDDIAERQLTPLESIAESLDELGVTECRWNSFLASTFLALRGWAGITKQVEERRDRVVRPIAAGSVVELLAVRLILDRVALAHVARATMGFEGALRDLRAELTERMPSRPVEDSEQRAFSVFQVAQFMGWTPEFLGGLDERNWRQLVGELEAFANVPRRRIFHLAYERRLYQRTLDAIANHNDKPTRDSSPPRFQAMFCIDEREESLRRHVEEVAPDAVTYGIAGFYFVDMYYKGLDDAHFVPLCPPVMRPRHWVVEAVTDDLAESERLRTQTRQALGKASHQVHVGSRSFLVGALFSGALGVLASIPLLARTLFPRVVARLRRMSGQFLRAPGHSRLDLECGGTLARDDRQPGFTLEALTDVAERILRDTGLTSGFSRLVFTFGHGSTSINNPHESAYNCGACGGSVGGASGRAAAQILNEPRVRERLRQRGIVIPDDTAFIGGLHNTSSDHFSFHDLDRLSPTHLQEFEAIRKLLETACERNAHERCRRFESASLTLTPAAARAHVEGRAEDLAQVRPELGHVTNAICIVGRRQRTRGLFLDRRAFLNSYDPTQDDEASTILLRILQAAVPVCAGINLEYYFSCVDNRGYGCGTKLPHNVAALLGVMDGAASDLRTGLPWQMVEIHEPVRILFVVETKPEKMLSIMDRNEAIGRLVRNGWIQLAVLNPDAPELQVYKEGAFHAYEPEIGRLFSVRSSEDWYRGCRDHLEFAAIIGPSK